MADDRSAEPLAMISLIVHPGGGRDVMAHQQAWVIPAVQADAFAGAMTERYGPPTMESVATAGQMIDAAARDAEAGHVFYEPPAGGSNG